MASTRQLKTKIGAVRNIKQITKAMQMVAATKMRKSQEVALNARPYAKKSFALLLHLLKQAGKEEMESVFLQGREGNKVALVVITSDKGLAGSFNSSVLRTAFQWKREQEQKDVRGRTSTVEIVAVGRKTRDFFKKQGATIAAEFFQFSDIVTFVDVKPLADWLVQAYKARTYNKIVVCSNQFVSALVQKVEIHDILPLIVEELGRMMEGVVPKTGKYSEIVRQEKDSEKELSFVLEPSREEIMRTLVENLIQVEIMYFVFESNASEHSSRMIAMKNATENANRLGEELTLALNKARQAAVTQELTEISTAKEALTSE
ncbi:MAG TPA: ATP synthase F1 subunit gamma [Candidatus Paceibacterota bacterium]